MQGSKRKSTAGKQTKMKPGEPAAMITSSKPALRQPVTPHDAAARSRINQRRRQRLVSQMRRFEAVLPDAPLGQRRFGLPVVAAGPIWHVPRNWWLFTVLLLVVSALVVWVHTDERWFLYREDVRFTGLKYLDEDQLWQRSKIDGWNLFWLDTEAVRQRLMEDSYVADADVYVSPLSGTVTIAVTEAKPAALWITDSGERWLLSNGVALEPRGITPGGLLQILDGPAAATAPGALPGSAISPEVLLSAESLVKILPGVEPLRFNRQIGLNFRLPGKPYWIYWGDGAEVDRKLENLAAGEALLQKSDVEGTVIDVRFERPYIK